MELTRRGLLWMFAGAGASVALPKKSFFFFDPISMPQNSLRGVRVSFDLDKLRDQGLLGGFPLTANQVARLCGLAPFRGLGDHPLPLEYFDRFPALMTVHQPRAFPSEARGSGKTTLMLCEAVACASTGRFARILNSGPDRDLINRAKEMALRCGVDPKLIGHSRVNPDWQQYPPGDQRRLLGDHATLFSDHFSSDYYLGKEPPLWHPDGGP